MNNLSDLVPSFQLYAVCVTCKRMERLVLTELIESCGPDTEIAAIRRRVRCQVCHIKTSNIRIVYVGPDNQVSAFHYRE